MPGKNKGIARLHKEQLHKDAQERANDLTIDLLGACGDDNDGKKHMRPECIARFMLARLDARLGVGVGAAKERAKYEKRIKAAA